MERLILCYLVWHVTISEVEPDVEVPESAIRAVDLARRRRGNMRSSLSDFSVRVPIRAFKPKEL